jgi:hypothetical protein
MRLIHLLSIGLMLLPMQAMAAVDCKATRTSQATSGHALQMVPIADELAATGVEGRGVGFASLVGDRVTVEEAVTRLHRHTCAAVASVANLPKPGDPGAYQPKTANDNTPWRFDMTQNGKRMTADEFDAWMKARGVRVVKGPATAAPAPAPAPTAEAPKKPAGKKKKP